MVNETDSEKDRLLVYEIRIEGHLNQKWAAWFEGLAMAVDQEGNTRLTGPVLDQTALHGLLKKVRDLGLTLLWVRSVGGDPPDLKKEVPDD